MSPGVLVAIAAAALAAARPGPLEGLGLALYDARAASAAAHQPASREVVLVTVDDATLQLAGGSFPIPRGALAAIVEEARAAGARVLALDFVLQDSFEAALADENAALERALAGGDVAMGAVLTRASGSAGDDAGEPLRRVRERHARPLGAGSRPERFALVPPLARFALAADALGGVSQEQAANGRVYALRHAYATAEGDYMSLPLATAWLARGRPSLRVEAAALRFGAARLPLDEDGRVLVRWRGPHAGGASGSTYPAVSAADLLRARLAREGEGSPPPPEALAPLRGSVAVICSTVAAAKDKRPTPVNGAAVGGEVIANAIDDLLRGESVRRWPRAWEALVSLAYTALVALAAVFVARSARGSVALLGASALAVAALLGGWWWLSTRALALGLWLPALVPMVAGVLAAGAVDLRLLGLEHRDRRFVHDALGRYTSPALVDALLANRALLDRFGGARQDLTVYFSDIRGFTSFSERLEPEVLVALLGEYFSALSEIVERHGGYVDKYIGDALMAIWGAPLADPDHALRACRAALEMRALVEARRPEWKERYGVEIASGAGLNTGPMVAGNIGSRRKANYTVLGDSVNLASRLEGATKQYGVGILVGEGTYRAARDGIVARPIELLQVKGKRRGVPVYELIGLAGTSSAADAQRLERWERAIAAYRAGRFEAALPDFEEVLGAAPADVPAKLYAARCKDLLAAPPAEDWDGVHVLHEK